MNIPHIQEQARQHMEKTIAHLENELTHVRAGKISPAVLEGITVEYYGSRLPIAQAANVTVADVRTLIIQPWEKNMLAVIEKAILAANIGITPLNDGAVIKLFQPPLTEERRREHVKRAHHIAETARISIRNIRREAIEQLKKLEKEHVSEDDIKKGEKDIQELTNKYIALVDKHLQAKEKEIMTV
ncbi:MAG: ribosome recycling factor [Chitinophagales bacterium]|nr:ribosome recycling factor [Chitinophagales bacterium]MDW8393237.1 ribosome recycling factor [Chitinophagales bacterium]